MLNPYPGPVRMVKEGWEEYGVIKGESENKNKITPWPWKQDIELMIAMHRVVKKSLHVS